MKLRVFETPLLLLLLCSLARARMAHLGENFAIFQLFNSDALARARISRSDENQVHMAGRGRGTNQNIPNDLLAQMVAAMQQVNENLHNLNQNLAPSPSSQPLVPPGPAEYRGLDEFCRRNSSQFQGGFAPDAVIEWVQGLERIFRAMICCKDPN
ncbi:hypothetical protein Lal_00011217 [Lupinus albus]|nr:hypothetical protein Lal_00011217 [Lupinus albus]